MLTVRGVPDERMEGLQELVIDYITKPFESDFFFTAIRKYLTILDQAKAGS